MMKKPGIFMTPEQREIFGIESESAEQDIFQWNMARMGVVLGNDGRGGSGVYIQLEDGRIALLTARHVVLPAVLSGEVTISYAQRGKSFSPAAIRSDRQLDLALLVVPEDIAISSFLKPEEWEPTKQPEIKKGMPVVACGVPGLLKSTPDAATRTIAKTTYLQYWTGIMEINGYQDLIECGADKSNKETPAKLAGMSGGPVFNNKKELIGINVLESSGSSSDERIYVLPRRKFGSLTAQFRLRPSGDSPMDYLLYDSGKFTMGAQGRSGRLGKFFITAIIEFFRSQNEPNHPQGRMGRITCLFFSRDAKNRKYPINIESIFYFNDDTAEEKIRAVRKNLSSILQGTQFQLIPEIQ